jgi:aspartate-semialdehyde dehydrogenase
LIGPTTTDGSRVRDALANLGIPGSRVDMFGTTRGEVLLSEYAGEARLVQEPAVEEIACHELIFLCEHGELGRRFVDAAHPGRLVIDLVGALPESTRAPLIHMDVNPEAARQHHGFVAVPHPLAIVLGELLHPLEREIGLVEVVALIIRPAADFGESGIEELREQTVRLLNFTPIPTDVFGRQLAFNILPQPETDASPRAGGMVERQVSELLGWQEKRLTLRSVAAPLFYGHALLLRLRLANGAGIEGVRAALEASATLDTPRENAPATPLDVAEECRTVPSEPAPDGLGGVWLWAAAGETGARAAEQAVRLAAALSDL